MFDWLIKRSASSSTARDLYGAVVTQARAPSFYVRLGVPDTAEGRYELVALHLVLLLERLGEADVADEALRRNLIETFIEDMDDSMREMGVGDLSVPKRVKKAAGGLYTRAEAYRAALAAPDEAALVAALKVYLYIGRDEPQAGRCAAYVRAMAAGLRRQSGESLRSGRVVFEDPGAVP